jgi:hypothetical protein
MNITPHVAQNDRSRCSAVDQWTTRHAGSEAIKLWAIYRRYSDELRQINDEKFRLVKDYGQQWGTMTNDQALNLYLSVA